MDTPKKIIWLIILLATVVIVSLVALILPSFTYAETLPAEIKVSWDADSVPDSWEQLKFFLRTADGTYDYENPIFTLNQSYVDGLSTPTETQFQFDAELYVNQEYFLVVRAYKGELHSIDSEEVSFFKDMTRPEAPTLSVEIIDGNYVFTWTKLTDRIDRFNLQWSYTSQSGFKNVVANTKELTYSIPVTTIWPVDETADTIHFVVVGITKEGVYSRWSNELAINKPVIVIAPSNIKVVVIQ